MNTINTHNLAAARKARRLIQQSLAARRAIQRAQRQALSAAQALTQAQCDGATRVQLHRLANRAALTGNRVQELLRAAEA